MLSNRFEPPEEEPPEDMTCSQCLNCSITPDEKSKYGYCTDCNDWVLLDENVSLLGCETWEL